MDPPWFNLKQRARMGFYVFVLVALGSLRRRFFKWQKFGERLAVRP
jgi:hypothetical protein